MAKNQNQRKVNKAKRRAVRKGKTGKVSYRRSCRQDVYSHMQSCIALVEQFKMLDGLAQTTKHPSDVDTKITDQRQEWIDWLTKQDEICKEHEAAELTGPVEGEWDSTNHAAFMATATADLEQRILTYQTLLCDFTEAHENDPVDADATTAEAI